MAPSLRLLVLLLAIPALGQNYFTNSNFSTPALNWNGGFYDASGWTIITNDGVANGWTWSGGATYGGGVTVSSNWLSSTGPGVGTPAPGGTGSQFAFLIQSVGTPAGASSLSQSITVPTNGSYNISFVAGNPSALYSIENLNLSVDSTPVGRWTAASFATGFVPISTNVTLTAGSHLFSFICDTNGVNQGQDGWGMDIGSVQTTPFYSGFTYNDTTHTAASDGTYNGTVNALNHIAVNGAPNWVLTVGTNNGVYVWSNSLSISLSQPVYVTGPSPNARPEIYFNTSDNQGIAITASTNHFVTLANLILDFTNNQPVKSMVSVAGYGCCFRITGVEFLHAAQSAFCILGGAAGDSQTSLGPFGLVDHSQFYMPVPLNYNCLSLFCNGNNIHYGWQQPMSWGTTNAVYVENCAFSQPNSIVNANAVVESEGGARWVYRFNQSTNMSISDHGIASGAHDSTLQVEVYSNTFTFDDSTGTNEVTYVGVFRGGSTLFFGNTVNNLTHNDVGSFLQFWTECASSQWQAEHCATQLQYPADYPGPQQVGQGSCTNGVSCTQTNWPSYIWGNNSGNLPIYHGIDIDAPFIQQGRDYFTNSVMPGYTELVYPHPLDTTNNAPPPAPTPSLLIPLGHIARQVFLH